MCLYFLNISSTFEQYHDNTDNRDHFGHYNHEIFFSRIWYSLIRWSVGSDYFLNTTEPLQSLFSIEPRPGVKNMGSGVKAYKVIYKPVYSKTVIKFAFRRYTHSKFAVSHFHQNGLTIFFPLPPTSDSHKIFWPIKCSQESEGPISYTIKRCWKLRVRSSRSQC